MRFRKERRGAGRRRGFFVFDFELGDAQWVEGAEDVELIPAFDAGVGNVENEGDGEEAEDPLAVVAALGE